MDLRSTPPERFSSAFDLAHEAAAAQAGAADFGDGDYRAGLRVLLESMECALRDRDPNRDRVDRRQGRPLQGESEMRDEIVQGGAR